MPGRMDHSKTMAPRSLVKSIIHRCPCRKEVFKVRNGMMVKLSRIPSGDLVRVLLPKKVRGIRLVARHSALKLLAKPRGVRSVIAVPVSENDGREIAGLSNSCFPKIKGQERPVEKMPRIDENALALAFEEPDIRDSRARGKPEMRRESFHFLNF